MYEAHFGFREKPFSLLPDPAFLYLSPKHAAALSLLEYALSDQAGFVVLTGEVGSGKTTLVRKFLKMVDRETSIGLVSTMHKGHGDLLRWVLQAFGVKVPADDAGAPYRAFVDYLLAQYSRGRRTILIVDEAQNMSLDALEELRLLSNVNADSDLLLQIILVGQPELLDKLRRPELRQFAQRIAVHYHLAPLEYPETRAYVRCRLQVAGGQPSVFAETAIAAVHSVTGGVPRLINSICDMALVYGFAEGRRAIELETVIKVARDKCASGLDVLPGGAGAIGDAIHRHVRELLQQSPPPEVEPSAANDGGVIELGERLLVNAARREGDRRESPQKVAMPEAPSHGIQLQPIRSFAPEIHIEAADAGSGRRRRWLGLISCIVGAALAWSSLGGPSLAHEELPAGAASAPSALYHG